MPTLVLEFNEECEDPLLLAFDADVTCQTIGTSAAPLPEHENPPVEEDLP